jgi:zinc transport system substrate-binding protein
VRCLDRTTRSGLLQCTILVALLAACSEPAEDSPGTAEADSSGTLRVYAVNYPLAYFAERIGGDAADVHFPAPPDVDPAVWVPGTDTITEYQQADLILLNGAGYAAWTQRVTLPASRLVDTSAGFADVYISADDAVAHVHGPEGEHEHGDLAFTTWLDPELATLQAAAVRDGLVRLRPERQQEFDAAFLELERDIEGVDDGLRAAFALLGGQPLLFSHPVYQYLDSRYDLNARSLHWEPDQSLSVADVDELNALRESHPATTMIWEAEPLPETRSRLAELGVNAVVVDPCANRPIDGDFLTCMRGNLDNMEALL